MDQPSTSASIQKDDEIKFALNSIIQAHRDDAKCVVETGSGALVSGGRDGVMKVWKEDGAAFEESKSIVQKDCLSINAIAYGSSAGLVFVGRKNGSIAIFNLVDVEPIKVFQGHKSNVCALHFHDESGFLMSGSWDHNAVVWPVQHLLQGDTSSEAKVGIGFLAGHTCSVWAVAAVPSAPISFLTGSADKSIKLWSNEYNEIGTLLGHSDVVRAIVVLSAQHFLSSSNDSSIILWDLKSGTILHRFQTIHQEFIYTLASLSFDSETKLIISCGEGGCIDIWRLCADFKLVHKQSLKMPVSSIWNVAPMKNKDFAVATSSGFVLVFTADKMREASKELQDFFFTTQYEEIEAKNKEMEKAKDPSFDMSRFPDAIDSRDTSEFRRIGSGKSPYFAKTPHEDPLTGTGRYVPQSTTNTLQQHIDRKRPKSHLVPLHDFYKFDLEGLSSKVVSCLRDMNLLQPTNTKLNDDEFCAAEQILNPASLDDPINECQILALEKGLEWSTDTIVPFLDIFRVALLRSEFNEIFCSLKSVMGNPPKGKATIGRMFGLLASEPPDAVRILICRSLANATAHEFGRDMLLTEISTFCTLVSKQLRIPKPALQISSSTALANFARILLNNCVFREGAELGPREDALRSIVSTVSGDHSFSAFSPVATIRLLQTIAQLLWGESTLLYLAIELELGALVGRIKDEVADEDVKSLVRDILGMLQAF